MVPTSHLGVGSIMNEDSPREQASEIESYGEWANMGAPPTPSTLGLESLQNPLLTLALGKRGLGVSRARAPFQWFQGTESLVSLLGWTFQSLSLVGPV